MRTMKSNILILISLIVFSLSGITAFAAEDLPEPTSDFFVYDETGTIGQELKDEIIEVNKALQSRTGAQVVVAVVKNTEGYSGAQEYGNELFEKWQIGDKEKDNGVLMLISLDERDLWIEIGYGLEGALPDGKVGRIRDQYIFPYFKQGDYESGVRNGFNAIVEQIKIEYNLEDLGAAPPEGAEEDGFSYATIIIFIIIMVIIYISSRKGGRGGRGGTGSSGGSSGGYFPPIIGGPSSGSGGFGGSSGGFGGFSGGGGSSGGGGAGGRW